MRSSAEIATKIVGDLRAQPHAYAPALRNIRKWHCNALAGESADLVLDTAQQLASDLRQDWKWVAYELVRFHAGAFAALTEARVCAFATGIESWEAVDGLGTILVGPMWLQGRFRDDLVQQWATAPGPWLPSLALVATVALNSGANGDPTRTLPICRQLATTEDPTVIKAMSHALRTLAKRDQDAVAGFMEATDAVISGRLKREVGNQLKFGIRRFGTN